MLLSRILSFTLACLLLVQSMPTLVKVIAFSADRDTLTQKHCINIAAPTLDCRAACYLAAQVAEIGQQLSSDSPDQQSKTNAPNHGVMYVLPQGLVLSEQITDYYQSSLPTARQLRWTTRYQDIAIPPPLA